MPEQVGSTFGGCGLGEPLVILLYIFLGPVAAIFNLIRLSIHGYRNRIEHRAYLSPSELDTVRNYLPWNIGISLLPLLPIFWSLIKNH